MGFTALIAGGLGAAGAIGSSLISSNAASNASQQQAQAQMAALSQQQALYNQGLGVQSNYFNTAQNATKNATNALSPYANAGQSVLPTLQGLLTPGQNQSALLAQTPGFQFASQYGTMAAQNALAAHGTASGGPLATAVSQYNNGLASTTWGNVVGALQNYASLGGNAAAGIASSNNNLASIAGGAGNAALGQSGVQGQLQGNTIGNIGNAQAAGTLGSANALAGGVNGATGGISNALLFSSLGGGGLGGGGGLYGPAYGGGNALTDAYGGSSANPAAGLTAADYGAGF